MLSEDRQLLNFLFLALQSHLKKQTPGRDRFLVLALEASCKSGYPDLAQQCRQIILDESPYHLLSHYSTSVEFLQSEEGQLFFRQVARFCSSERAEHLAQGLDFFADHELEKENNDVPALAQKMLNSMS